MAQFVIPSIFTAQDKFSGPLRQMANNAASFGNSMGAAISNAEKGFNRMLPSLNNAQKQFFSFASAAAATAGVISSINFAFNGVKEYESNLAELKAITGATTDQFGQYKKQIESVAVAQKMSSVDVARAFTVIGNAQPELLQSAKGLSEVTDATILLSKAARMELDPAANALTTIMNQFGLKAADAKRSVDMLAAGSRIGSSEINDTAAALQKFGTVAVNAGVKIDESIALVQLGARFQKGSEAGEKFRNMLITMSAIKVQDPKALNDLKRLGVNLDVVQNSALPLQRRLQELSKISKDSAAIFHVFGKENQAMATGILNSVDGFDKLLKGVQTPGEAMKMAAENMNTLFNKIKELQAAFINFFTTNEETNGVLSLMKDALIIIADNIGPIITGFVLLAGALLGVKLAFIAARTFAFLYSAAVGISAFVSGAGAMAIRGNAVALGFYTFMAKAAQAWTWLMTSAQWAWNAALAANPIVLVVLAVLALIAVVIIIIAKFDEWGAMLSILLGPLGLIIGIIMSFKRNWDMIVKAFEENGILGALKAIGATLLDAILYPIQQILDTIYDITGFEWAKDATEGLKNFRASMGVDVSGSAATAPPSTASDAVNPAIKAVDPVQARQESFTESVMSSTEKQKVTLDVNLPQGANGKVSENTSLIPIKIGSTVGFGGIKPGF